MKAATIHIRRAKNGTPGIHSLQGDELRLIRALVRENPNSTFLFLSERRAPLSVDGAQKLIERLGEAAWPLSRSTPTCCGTRRATRWRAAESIHAPFKHSWVADKRVRNIWAK